LFILFGFNLDGKIGTSEFTELAADTVCRPSRKYLIDIIEFQDIFGTEMDANTTPLAPFRIYYMRF